MVLTQHAEEEEEKKKKCSGGCSLVPGCKDTDININSRAAQHPPSHFAAVSPFEKDFHGGNCCG